jgi:hypothetical protein
MFSTYSCACLGECLGVGGGRVLSGHLVVNKIGATEVVEIGGV